MATARPAIVAILGSSDLDGNGSIPLAERVAISPILGEPSASRP
jgi:hypothetical protein